jgi:hypothetical protein
VAASPYNQHWFTAEHTSAAALPPAARWRFAVGALVDPKVHQAVIDEPAEAGDHRFQFAPAHEVAGRRGQP